MVLKLLLNYELLFFMFFNLNITRFTAQVPSQAGLSVIG